MFRRDIHGRITTSMTLHAVFVILVIGAVSYVSVQRLIRENHRISMESNARQQALKVEASLNSLRESISHLSSNHLLVNALVDTSGNKVYIDSFVKSYRPTGTRTLRLTLCDFQGNPVASNRPSPVRYGSPEMLRQTIENGFPFSATISPEGTGNDGTWLILAYPIVWSTTNKPEGMLVAEFPVGELVDEQLFAGGGNGTGLRLASGKRILYARNYLGSTGLQRFDITLAVGAPLDSLGLSLQVEDHNTVSLWWLVPAYAVSGAFLLSMSIFLARRISLSVTSSLRGLGEVAQRIAEGGSLECHAEVAGPDDVKALATTFNGMIDKVKASGEELERRVRERTAELSAANEELTRINHEKALAIEGLNDAMGRISTLRGLLPICASCKKIRDDKGYWNQIEVYISKHTLADFSHGICPSCMDELYKEELGP
jgi:HAMP domain-containing protein